jgi:hypothetical protein
MEEMGKFVVVATSNYKRSEDYAFKHPGGLVGRRRGESENKESPEASEGTVPQSRTTSVGLVARGIEKVITNK